ncbi:hypothetical protein WMF30_28170 [Sorangium sp. So ce134]
MGVERIGGEADRARDRGTMNWRTEWMALSNRIQGLADAASYFARADPGGANYASHDAIPRAVSEVNDALYGFYRKYRDQAPSLVKPIVGFNARHDSCLRGHPVKMISELMLVKSEVDYILADTKAGCSSANGTCLCAFAAEHRGG